MTNEINNLIILIDSLRDYFKSNHELIEAGINLNKLEPHKMLFNTLYQQIINQYGLNRAMDIIKFAECSKKDDNSSFISAFFKNPQDTDIDKTVTPKICNKEQVRKDNTTPGHPSDKAKDECSTVKKSEATTNTTKNEPVNNPKYYVNGKKVSKEEYVDAESKFRELKSKYSHAFEDIFDDLFNQYFK